MKYYNINISYFVFLFVYSRLNIDQFKPGLTVNIQLFVLFYVMPCGVFLQGLVIAMSQTDSEMVQGVMIVLTAVEIASVGEIATTTGEAETMIVEVGGVSFSGISYMIL